MQNYHNVSKGIFWAGIGAASWGVSDTVLQTLSQNINIPALWMLATRTFFSGLILLIYNLIVYRKTTFTIFKSPAVLLSIISYGVFGLGLNLYTFYISTQEGNASMATILQYLSPLFIVIGAVVFQHVRPKGTDLISFFLALLGVFFCITAGDFTHLSISFSAFIWGLASGIAAALCIVLPKKANETTPPPVVLGWGTLIAALMFNLIHPIWTNPPHVTTSLVASIACVVLLGTIIPFGLLLHASNFAPSDVVSIMDALEPIVTIILSVIFLRFHVNLIEAIGVIIVLVAIFILQQGRKVNG
ncbi:EamA family transporter [Lactobacillus alvi]|uniref:EamA family transporter n=1 Tax=Limosilactobacillus alvi TaxID=990412 RepID=A0ABS2EPF3_9LACO|nr:DMT family transporter [Limosilactobacillus alvi]MBM6754382.1 EamA family transporter [Limosilactobacillus alvi]